MIRRSSIFSFSTLRASFRPSGAVVAAAALIAAAELGIRWMAPRTPWRAGYPSFDLLVDHYRFRLAKDRPDVWLMGNSTLAKGVDVEQLEAASDRSIQALPVGSGTLAGQTAMLEYFLRRAPVAPRRVVVCLTKDDVNTRGTRAEVSAKYLQYGSWRSLAADRLFRLDDLRTTGHAYLRNLWRSRPATVLPAAPARFTGQLTGFESNSLDRLAGDFTFDSAAFSRLESLAREHRFDVAVCLMPVTDVYAAFHDHKYPRQTCDSIAARISALCLERGFAFRDFSLAAPGRYELFEDNRHLNADGREWFTPRMAEVLASPSP